MKNIIAQVLEKLKIKVPIIQAPMAGATTSKLIAAVSNAGGLGSLGAGYLNSAELRKNISEIKSLTDKPFAVNLFVSRVIDKSEEKIKKMNTVLIPYRNKFGIFQEEHFPEKLDIMEEQTDVLIAEKVPIVSFTFGVLPSKIIQKLKKNNVILIGTATTVNEGIHLEKNGCDIIVAQGSEAGGHRGSFLAPYENSLIGSIALIPQVTEKVKIPVFAAGGIMNGKGFAAALALGACGAQLGTAFLTCIENTLAYKDMILSSSEESTQLTTVFSGKPARGINNQFMIEMEKYKKDIPDYPLQHWLTQGIRKKAAAEKRTEFMSLWAGQGTRLSQELSADQLIKEIMSEAGQIIQNLSETSHSESFKFSKL